MQSAHDKFPPYHDQSIWEFAHWPFPKRPTVRILVVVDGAVGVDWNYFFGVGKVIEILRKKAPHNDSEYKYVRFEVETATRDAAAMGGPADYNNFRFDQMLDAEPLINRFHQIWCFGFHPGNGGDPSDAPIESHPTQVSQSELRTLTTWMNERRGGLLAMGDHHFLGATLAWKIPRVRAMRRWTNVDGVPPINGPISSNGGPTRYRHDTNQPQSPDQADPASISEIPDDAQLDGEPLPLQVRYYGGFMKRPHPILCTRTHGVMNVLPDHPHEGWVYDDREVQVDIAHDFGGGVAGPDFPNAVDGGSRPLPQAIAWAHPWPEPPYEHEKTPTPVTQFAVIGAYDGHRADIGRVVVDSTWHHWFNMNIDGLQIAGGDNWAKIKSYFRNVAVWLSPPAQQYAMLTYAAFWSTGSTLAIEGYDGGMPSWELGESARDILGQYVSSCMIYDWIRPLIPIELLERFPKPLPEECLTCPPWPLIEKAVLGGIIKAMLPERDRLVAARQQGKAASVDLQQLINAVNRGAVAGLAELHTRWQRDLEHSRRSLQAFEKPSPFASRLLANHFPEILADLEIVERGEME
ncbi:MAG TPA: hypothetical protein VGD45_06620 [Steroidobacter sp.]|uniref:hypothetical protein n=1 Tax=Steroidobacter sp. TaxID=1978227 RepID=UPI002EDA521A